MASQAEISLYLSQELRLGDFEGIDKSTNGFEIDREGEIEKLALAVDACEATVRQAVGVKANVLLVHHGLFWGNPQPIVGRHYRVVKMAMEANLGILALHLPLDAHPRYGNNIGLCEELELVYVKNWGNYKGLQLLLIAKPKQGEVLKGEELVSRYKNRFGTPLAVYGAPLGNVERVGICSGGGLFAIEDAVKAGCNVLLTGDANHTAHHQALELGISIISGGHYQTETIGVQRLGTALRERFALQTVFLHVPTGL